MTVAAMAIRILYSGKYHPPDPHTYETYKAIVISQLKSLTAWTGRLCSTLYGLGRGKLLYMDLLGLSTRIDRSVFSNRHILCVVESGFRIKDAAASPIVMSGLLLK